jgi:hypothetical protein
MALNAYTSLSTVDALDCRPVAAALAPGLRVKGRFVVPDWVTSIVVAATAIAATAATADRRPSGVARNLGLAVG